MAHREDPIPSIDALEAAARRDREETQDLLAGFDRPGRVPKRPRERDFVSHFTPPAKPPSARRVDPPTVLVPRKRNERIRSWLPWASAALLMALFGSLVAFVATGDAPPASQKELAPQPSSITTIMSASRDDDLIPPPDPAVSAPESIPDPEPTPATRPRRTKREARGLEANPKPAPRDDFIRDL